MSLAEAKSGSYTVIDVRTLSEFEESHVAGSLHIDYLAEGFQEKIQKLDKSVSYKLYCRSGNRSGKAAQLMKQLGFKEVENIGSLAEAAEYTKRPCEGKKTC